MGPEGAVNVLYRRELAAAEDAVAMRLAKVQEFKDKFANPYVAADRGFMSVLLTPGMRATAVEVKAVSTAGGFILPNDHVDILLTRAAPKSGNTTVCVPCSCNPPAPPSQAYSPP